MKRLHWLAILMTVTILGIAGFQFFWLKQNYEREKKNLNFKTETSFNSTVRNLQVKKLKLDNVFSDSLDFRNGFFMSGPSDSFGPMGRHKGNPANTFKILQDKFADSLFKESAKKIRGLNIKKESFPDIDSLNFPEERVVRGSRFSGGDNVMRLLSRVDSLQDSIKVAEITDAYSESLKKQKIKVPFRVLRLDTTTTFFNEPGSNEVTVGFIHPITYKLKIGNTFPYLFGQIVTPFIFSLFLVGITIISFLLLYNSLLRQQKLALIKNEFISNITHELKTPIATVGVAIEALKNFNAMQDPQRTREYLDISSNELQRLGLLVDKVLKLSMFEKKEVEIKYEILNLKEVVDEVISSMRLQFEKYHARVSVKTDGELNLKGDRLHLLSVVFNLLDNALKYSKANPLIEVNIKGYDKNIVLSISDNGIGIPEEYKDKIFEKFFRVPAGDTHNAKGYGLGLSYVAHVVHQHNGTIVLESRKEAGSKFIITLPKQQA